MNIKYYQITERDSEYPSVGVIKVENNVFPVDKIEFAISQHLDAEIKESDIIEVDDFTLEIHITREDGTEDIFDAELTWLYFDL
jgi:hypothetical protein